MQHEGKVRGVTLTKDEGRSPGHTTRQLPSCPELHRPATIKLPLVNFTHSNFKRGKLIDFLKLLKSDEFFVFF
jgi:hypothetical protein